MPAKKKTGCGSLNAKISSKKHFKTCFLTSMLKHEQKHSLWRWLTHARNLLLRTLHCRSLMQLLLNALAHKASSVVVCCRKWKTRQILNTFLDSKHGSAMRCLWPRKMHHRLKKQRKKNTHTEMKLAKEALRHCQLTLVQKNTYYCILWQCSSHNNN